VRKTVLREIRVLKDFRHPNIIRLLQVFRDKGKLYLVFEFMERTVLEELDLSPTGLPPSQIKEMLF
jgi:cyclin-dependent kinase-like